MTAERDQTGAWTDYIYAGGRKVARVSGSTAATSSTTTVTGFHMRGSSSEDNWWASTVSWFLDLGSLYAPPNTNLEGYATQPGDKLVWKQFQHNAVGGGQDAWFWNCGGINYPVDTDGVQWMYDGVFDSWHTRTMDLTPYIGCQFQTMRVGVNHLTTAGSWDFWLADMKLQHADNSSFPVYTAGVSSDPWLFYGIGYGETGLQGAVDSMTTTTSTGGSGPSVTYTLTDHLGTANLEFDAAGTLTWKGEFAPFGQELSTTNTSNRYKFTGKERDTESGNDYFGARYYASSTGRFMSPDPIIMNSLRLINPQRWNKYSYVINNPLILTDPSGKDAIYVDFNKMASGYGHAGIISVHADGSATYSRYGPASPGRPVGTGEVQTDSSLPTVQFGANGLPTEASTAALISAVAGFETKIEGSTIDPSTVGLDYFKTTPSETAALDAYIKQQQDASNSGKAPTYCVVGSSCRDYALGGLVAGGVIDRWRSPYFSVVPNTLFFQLQQGGFTDGHKDPESGTKKNTTPPCLKSRDTGGCV